MKYRITIEVCSRIEPIVKSFEKLDFYEESGQEVRDNVVYYDGDNLWFQKELDICPQIGWQIGQEEGDFFPDSKGFKWVPDCVSPRVREITLLTENIVILYCDYGTANQLQLVRDVREDVQKIRFGDTDEPIALRDNRNLLLEIKYKNEDDGVVKATILEVAGYERYESMETWHLKRCDISTPDECYEKVINISLTTFENRKGKSVLGIYTKNHSIGHEVVSVREVDSFPSIVFPLS